MADARGCEARVTLALITSVRKIRLVIDFGNICKFFKVIDSSIVDY